MSGKVGHRGKIFPRAAGGAKTLCDHVLLVCRERLWGSRARRKVPVEFYSQLSGRENKHFSNSRSLTLCIVIGCAPTRQGRGSARWVILLENITSYPEMCAEHVFARSAPTISIPVSAFFTAFFYSCARARSTGRAVTVLEYGYF